MLMVKWVDTFRDLDLILTCAWSTWCFKSLQPQKSNVPIVFSFTMLATVHVYRFYNKFCCVLLFMLPIHRGKRNHQIRVMFITWTFNSLTDSEKHGVPWTHIAPAIGNCFIDLEDDALSMKDYGIDKRLDEHLDFWVGFLRDSWAKDILCKRQVWIHHSLQGE